MLQSSDVRRSIYYINLLHYPIVDSLSLSLSCNMGKKENKKESKLSWCMKAPIRILIKLRDLYIQGMNECSGRLDYGMAMGCPTPQISTLPKSFSTNSARSTNNDDFRELMRAASTRSQANKAQWDLPRKQQPAKSPATTRPNNFSRSRSVGFGRIDEDKPCDFGEDDIKVNTDHVYPRSRSYAVNMRTRVF